jgi:hypothetical protein
VYTSVRRSRVRGSMAALGRRVEQGVVPLLAQGPGFRSYVALDAGAGRLVTVAVFAERAEAEAPWRLAAGAGDLPSAGPLVEPVGRLCRSVVASRT